MWQHLLTSLPENAIGKTLSVTGQELTPGTATIRSAAAAQDKGQELPGSAAHAI